MTSVVSLNPEAPRRSRLAGVVATLETGGIVALPTETFYGLAADAFNEEACRAVNRLKGKHEDDPLLLLLSRPEQVRDLFGTVHPAARDQDEDQRSQEDGRSHSGVLSTDAGGS